MRSLQPSERLCLFARFGFGDLLNRSGIELARTRSIVCERLAIELESKAHTDALTGLLNRRGLESALTRELARARRGGHSVCVALVDLDGNGTRDVVVANAFSADVSTIHGFPVE